MSQPIIPRISLDRIGKEASVFGLGGFHQVEISSEIVANVIDTYLSLGGNYIETARSYGGGASEEKIGRALQGRRDEVILSSKTAAATGDEARRDLEASLAALGTDRLDFCFFHGVGRGKLETITSSGGAVEGLTRAKEEGLIGGLGLSSHDPPAYLAAMDRIDLDVILLWCNYLDNLNFPLIPEQIIPQARRRGVIVTAMKPLGDGFLHRSVDQAIAYCLGCGADIAVCGANRVEHVQEVARAVANGPADAQQSAEILAAAEELGQYVCRRCGGCSDDLMDTFRLEGEFDRQMIDYLPRDPHDHALRKVLSKWFSHDEAAKAEFAESGRDTDTLEEEAAGRTCPYGIDVPRKTRIALAKLTGQPPQKL